MGDLGDGTHARPHEVRDAAEFVALLRRLKERSGLSYRRLEERAAERGEVLPRSTMADVLRHGVLPRAETLEVFLRVCGEERNVPAWLEARNRVAALGAGTRTAEEREAGTDHRPEHGEPSAAPRPGPDPGDGGAVRPRRAGRRFGSPKQLLGMAVVLLALLGGGYFTLAAVHGGGGATGAAGDSDAPGAGTYRIRSLASSLCLSERDGEDAGHVYQSACAGSIPAYALEEKGEGVYRIRSLHPVFGYGCLGVENAGTRRGARMMDDYCGHRGTAERFRLEPAGDRGYRIRPVHTDACVSVPGGSVTQWTPIVQSPCVSGDTGQVFRFDPVPTPSAVPDVTGNG
ncbi:RICIN domain-containing protein [Streptomyces capillispiralis]|uniref:Ricin-type beta-trefoil lectin protein n=1 Tax=Streptomyces capillispiralis TaxID=68182 RepID=A0A561TRW6_9ACTN|nr:RICIN domain-containing protein [Streptomyces capillispiralis]TWF89854.1 ricin-type beta-trefoil lectin protein [Streptomyces capillispiralis]GHH95676.1 hypothetical protein GCM10017779_61330 [Streptomyces capillispiralis]